MLFAEMSKSNFDDAVKLMAYSTTPANLETAMEAISKEGTKGHTSGKKIMAFSNLMFQVDQLLAYNTAINQVVLLSTATMEASIEAKRKSDSNFNLGVLRNTLKTIKEDIERKLLRGKSQADIYKSILDDMYPNADAMDTDDNIISGDESNSDEDNKRMTITKGMLEQLRNFKV